MTLLYLISVCREQADIVFVMDSSGSITVQYPQNWDLMKDFIYSVCNAFTIGFDQTRVGIVKFSSSARIEFYLDQHYSIEEVKKAMDRIDTFGGETNIAGGLRLMRNDVFQTYRGDRPDIKNIAIVITDGIANVRAETTVPEAEKARDEGIEIFTIGITNEVDERELREIASPPERSHVFRVQDFDRINDILDNVISRACEVVPTPGPPAPGPVITPSPTTTTGRPTLPPVEGWGHFLLIENFSSKYCFIVFW